MPKPFTFPDLFDDAKRISITDLRKWGYLTQGRCMSGTITWRREGEVTGSVGLAVDMRGENPCIEFCYTLNGEPVQYRIYFDEVASNLGKGTIWYFLCPQTMKRCRVLYLHRGRFIHREGCTETMYRKQTYSPRTRALVRLLDAHLEAEEAETAMYGKHFRTHYKGRQTKRCSHLLQKMKGAFEHPYQLERLMLM